jgi:hypothetical protein
MIDPTNYRYPYNAPDLEADHLQQGREGEAVVAFETQDTVTKHIESINYCGHHAEVLHQGTTLTDESEEQA